MTKSEKFDELVDALKSSFRREESLQLLNEFLLSNNYEMKNPTALDFNEAFEIMENFCKNLNEFSMTPLEHNNTYYDVRLHLNASYCSYLNEKEIPFWIVRTALIDWKYF